MKVHIKLLGGFEVTVDEAAVPVDAWSRRHASALVKVLALARGRRLHRDQVIDLPWPDMPAGTAPPPLHKAAPHARRAPGTAGGASLVLPNHLVGPLPATPVLGAAGQFRSAGEAALASGSADRAVEALGQDAGPLLPEDLYEPWSEEPREALRQLRLDLLRLA